MKIIFLFILLLIPLVSSDTTFFDQDDFFIMGESSATGGVIGGTTDGGDVNMNGTAQIGVPVFPRENKQEFALILELVLIHTKLQK